MLPPDPCESDALILATANCIYCKTPVAGNPFACRTGHVLTANEKRILASFCSERCMEEVERTAPNYGIRYHSPGCFGGWTESMGVAADVRGYRRETYGAGWDWGKKALHVIETAEPQGERLLSVDES